MVELRERERSAGADARRAPLIAAEDPPQFAERPFHFAAAAIDVVGPAAELLEGNGRRFVEAAAIEEDLAHHVAEEAGRTVVGRRSAGEEALVPRARAAVLPQHARLGI